MDLILNGQAQGSVATRLLNNNFDVSVMRPYIGKDGRSYVTINENGKTVARPTSNANATLKYNEWKLIDDAVMLAARERLTVVNEFRSRGLTYNVPNAMGHTVMVSQRMGDITGATISMDPARKSEQDRPEFDLVNLPLPVIHKDFQFNARQIATSRNSGTPLDVTMAQLASRRVAEEAEKLMLGTSGSFSYGGGTIYGLTNFPQRLTKTLTLPTAGGWTGATLIAQLLAMRQQSIDNFNFGPWLLITSPSWDPYLDADYVAAFPNGPTLRNRILQINGFAGVIPAVYLTGYQVIMVQLTTDTVREVIGMDITTLQWETEGGMVINYKVMAILVPQLRADINNRCGIIHGVGA